VVSGPLSVDPGTVTGTVGIRIGGDCPAQDVLVRAEQTALVDVLGGVGLAFTVIFGFLLVFLARRRTGGWLRRAAIALVPGLLTGLGEAATLYDTGVAKPFAAGWWGLAGAGVALALLLPLTRLRRRRAAAPAPAFPGAPAPLPDLGRYIPETLFARTAAGTVYRAFDPATQQRVLLKVAHPEPLTVPVPLPGAPVSTVPGSGAPAPGMPISAVPGPVIPGQFVPGQFVPGQLNPVSGMPVSGVPGYGPPGAPMSAPPGFPAPGYPAPGYPVSGVPGYPTGAFPVPGYPTGGFPAPGYPPPGSAAPGYPVPGSPVPGSSPLGFPAPGSPAPGLPTSAIPAQGGAAPVSGVPVSVPPTFPGPVSAIPDAAQPVGAQAVPTEGPAGTPAEAPVATPAAGQPSPTDETARLDPPATSGAVPEPDRGPSAPVEYLVPGLGTGPTTAAQPATGSGTQLTLTQQRFLRDADVMRRLDNPNCLHARDAFGPVVVTDYVDGMPLRQVLAEKGRLTGPQAMVVLAGALRGLGAVHDLGLVHRDVTPPNIYLDQSGRAVLADFESAAPGTEPVPAAAESAVYLSPEQR
ncbi:MAG TPA: protein kinase, partial [Rugosimonospora sp.]|nr:protein kinase [Rugosimonospora sp.]